MNTFPSHALGPFQHRVGIDQFGTVPVLFQDSPATFHRIVFAMVRRIVQEADGFADVIGKLDNSLEELRAPTIVFRPVIGLDLELCGAIPHLGRLTRPPRVEAVDDEIAGLGRTSEGPVEVSTVFIDDTKRGCVFPRIPYRDPPPGCRPVSCPLASTRQYSPSPCSPCSRA